MNANRNTPIGVLKLGKKFIVISIKIFNTGIAITQREKTLSLINLILLFQIHLIVSRSFLLVPRHFRM